MGFLEVQNIDLLYARRALESSQSQLTNSKAGGKAHDKSIRPLLGSDVIRAATLDTADENRWIAAGCDLVAQVGSHSLRVSRVSVDAHFCHSFCIPITNQNPLTQKQWVDCPVSELVLKLP